MYKQSFTLDSAAQADAVRAIDMIGTTPDAVKDAGRVRVGNGMLRFTTSEVFNAVKDTGRVRIGNGMLRF